MSQSADVDHYAILNCPRGASKKQIEKSFRKQALKYHPDKNPGNKTTDELYAQLEKSKELILDPAKRAVYDKLLDGKAAALARNQKMDGERKKFKDELDAREKSGSASQSSKKPETHYEKLTREMERVRQNGSELLRAEQEKFRQKTKEDTSRQPISDDEDESAAYHVTLKWQAKKTDAENGGYSTKLLEDRLSQYGKVNVVISSRKRGSAIAEYESYSCALTATQRERGLPSNPLTLTLISKPPPVYTTTSDAPRHHVGQKRTLDNLYDDDIIPASQNKRSDIDDFESMVLQRLRQAAEQKRFEKELVEAAIDHPITLSQEKEDQS